MNTKQQVEALATAYARHFNWPKNEVGMWLTTYDHAERVLRWLLEDHAVVGKDKVRNLYRALENDLPHIEKDDEWAINEAMERMEKIFGKELVKEMEQ